MNTQIQKIAESMKVYASFHPFNPIEVLEKGVNMADYQGSFEFEGYDILATLTLDTIGKHKAWHVSVGTTKSGLELPSRVVRQLQELFLPCKGGITEIPSSHGKLVRQFLELV